MWSLLDIGISFLDVSGHKAQTIGRPESHRWWITGEALEFLALVRDGWLGVVAGILALAS
jgi:hypothetical protein